jgi:hypothetical protein
MTSTDLLLVVLFPIIFMIHDFEEIIMMQWWAERNRDVLQNRFPKIYSKASSVFNHSTAAFALAVAEEFILFSIITFSAVIFDWYFLWLGLFMGIFIHCFMHIAQFVVLRRYVPCIVTSVLILPYFIFTFIRMTNYFTTKDFFIWTAIAVVLLGINLLLAHKLSAFFDRINRPKE